MPDMTIRDMRVILTAPGDSRLVVVKVETSGPGLYGLGCATFTQRHQAVRSAWHGPGDVSPVGHAANLGLPNFGVQEFGGFTETEQEVFPGCPEVRGGYLYPNDAPGWGIDPAAMIASACAIERAAATRMCS